ncbi:MAG: aminotransferase class I/II-fold pyridoxal phosphate-dependent enzyme, partial [Pseudomonadota bacterium]
LKLTPDTLEAAVGPRTHWLMLNSPSNPSGAGYTALEYRALMDVVRRHPHLWVLSDDIYEHIIYDDFAFATPAAVAPDLKDRILTVNGVSKAHAMTGWRLGFCGGPAPLIKAMTVVQSQATSAPCSISQAAAIAALDGDTAHLDKQRAAFQKRRDFVVGALRDIPGIACHRPQGAFYAFPDCRALIQERFESDSALCRHLLEEAHVALVPGSAFGKPGHLRLSYAASDDDLKTALGRVANALS